MRFDIRYRLGHAPRRQNDAPAKGWVACGVAVHGFRLWLVGEKGYAVATVSMHVKKARQFFSAAIEDRLLEENPFHKVEAGSQENQSRFYFVPREDAEKVLEACPDAEWRALFALARWGGLRVPSEVLALRWVDIDWERDRMVVTSSKTAHHEGKGTRIVPLFPELRRYLEVAFEAAEPGAEFVVTRYRGADQNLRTQLDRIARKAGLEPWGKPWQNLRSTRETELAETFPSHVVCGWIGNSPQVAAKHYLQTTEEHFERAVDCAQNCAQYKAEQPRKPEYPKSEEPGITEVYEAAHSCTRVHIPPRGVEPLFSD